MTAAAPAQARQKYDLGFAKWVYENIDGGDKLLQTKLCATIVACGTSITASTRHSRNCSVLCRWCARMLSFR